ncbi:MAG: hypothetical protein JST90_16050 [Bacteroidetes bacterium]|nr:hypothetical protein [Bacteroidota bacterium]
MKKVIAIVMLFVVLVGTVVKDTSVSKAAKSMYSMNDSDKDDSSSNDDSTDGKEYGKESADQFHLTHTEFTFSSDIYQTLFSSVSTHCLSIDDPYLDSISQPPEVRA